MGIPQFVDAIADSWLSDEGRNIEDIVRAGLSKQDLGVVQGEERGFEPMSLEQIRKEREETIRKMKEYKRGKYLAKTATSKGATDDMILEGRNLVEQEANQQAKDMMRSKGIPNDEDNREEYKKFYNEAKRLQEKEFQSAPLKYIRQFGRSGEGVGPDKLFELQASHRRDEAEVNTTKEKIGSKKVWLARKVVPPTEETKE